MDIDSDPASPELMRLFYSRIYPFRPIFTWLQRAYTPGRNATNREFAFTLKNDVYLRYQSFQDAEEFKKKVCHYNPTRFEIGPIYDARPKDKKTLGNRPLRATERELVFDIDMTDYDPIRTCCSGADICKRCWAYISAAVKVLDSAIREEFGYQHLLWVYSGRRGIHLWVSDQEAFTLSDQERKTMVGYLHVVSSGDSDKQVHVRLANAKGPPAPLCPSLRSAVNKLNPLFYRIVLQDQDCFASEEGYNKLLKLIPDRKVVESLTEKWTPTDGKSSEDRWDDFRKEIKKYAEDSINMKILQCAMEDIVLQYTYPRLDAEVSKHRNHLLKAPFCVHPKTGRVCVPVDPDRVESFDPAAVPTVAQLVEQLDATPTTSDWDKTSLKPFVEMLTRHNTALLAETMRAKKEEKTETMDW
ncbi:prim-pol domain-containing protein [Flagelloscypha sp. PMI_526]|nr:prim-pol domain-containing protein [Flagelloscypha sp. PMI_526]